MRSQSSEKCFGGGGGYAVVGDKGGSETLPRYMELKSVAWQSGHGFRARVNSPVQHNEDMMETKRHALV